MQHAIHVTQCSTLGSVIISTHKNLLNGDFSCDYLCALTADAGLLLNIGRRRRRRRVAFVHLFCRELQSSVVVGAAECALRHLVAIWVDSSINHESGNCIKFQITTGPRDNCPKSLPCHGTIAEIKRIVGINRLGALRISTLYSH